MRVLENEDKLIVRNQSWEEGEKLREVLQPQVTELRYALLQQYKKLYNMPEADQ